MIVSTAIVTVVDVAGATIGDFEFPLQVPVENIIKRFIEFLKAMDNEKYSDISNVYFKFKNNELKGQDTFWDMGIWDGSVIEFNYSGR